MPGPRDLDVDPQPASDSLALGDALSGSPQAPANPLDQALVSAPRRRRRKPPDASPDRGAISSAEWQHPALQMVMRLLHGALLLVLLVAGIGPMLLLVRFAVTPTQDILRTPLSVFPHGVQWSNLSIAWNEVHISTYFFNTIVIAVGYWFVQILVATTGGFVLAVLRPAYAKVINALVIATLFVPGVILLVPLYLTILHPPLINASLINNYLAVWLPAGASAFNVVIVSRFFDSLPHSIFEAAEVDGAGAFRLFWSVVLPMSRPILGVISVFAIIASWKDFLWPLLVLKDPNIQPLSVRLPAIQAQTDLGVFLAALAISTFIPVVVFLLFQRLFLSGAGLGGAVKG